VAYDGDNILVKSCEHTITPHSYTGKCSVALFRLSYSDYQEPIVLAMLISGQGRI